MKSPRSYLFLTASLLGCAGADSTAQLSNVTPDMEESRRTMTWEEFRASTYQEADTGIFVVDGDIPVTDVKQLEEFYQRVVAGRADVSEQGLIIHQAGGLDARWPDSQKKNLTYCVSSAFGARHATVVQDMAAATSAWEGAADVKFVHVAAADGNCTRTNNDVLFDVNPVSAGGQYLARAFFPNSARSGRNILIDGSAFNAGGGWSLTAVLRHELGHVLGFRHEHTRAESGACFEDKSWRALTPYDAASVMHYPQCNGRSTGEPLSLTAQDKLGVAAVYGAPGTGGSTPPPVGATTEWLSGSVALGESRLHSPFSVASGTELEVVMTGAGDPDLYVRFGAQPTAARFNCRPYLTGPSESCRLTVPVGQTQAHVMVRGYARATYQLSVRYTR